MPRDRFVIEKTTVRGANGNEIRAELKAAGAALALFSPADRNRIIRDAMLNGADRFMAFWLPKRFEQYARTLGYHAGPMYEALKKRKFGHSKPLVLDGRLQKLVMSTAYTVSKGKGDSCYSEIRFRRGTTQSQVVRAVLSSLAPNEVKDCSKAVGKALAVTESGDFTEQAGAKQKQWVNLTWNARLGMDMRQKKRKSGNQARRPKRGNPRKP